MDEFWSAFDFEAYPAAQTQQCIVKNGVRITVIGPKLIRIEKQNSSVFCDEPTQAVVCRDFGKCEYSCKEEKESVKIITQACEYLYSYKTGRLEYIRLENGKCVTDYRKGNLKGTCRTLDNTNGHVALGDGILSRNGVAVLDDSDSLIISRDGSVRQRKCKENDVYYFAYGTDYKLALKDYFRLTGMPPLVPRFTLGNWWSRYKAYTQSEYIQLMSRFEAEEIPITVATIDMDWHWVNVIEKFGKEARDKNTATGPLGLFYRLMSPGWTGYSWNTELFPEPEKFLQWLKEHNYKVTMNLHPASGCKFYEDAYDPFADFMGADKENKEQICFDITDKKFVEGYFRFLHHPHEKNGVDFWWIDWQQGTKTKIPGLDPLWLLNHYHYYDITRKNVRPLILSRFAGAGSHRYPLGFSGDTAQTWAALKLQPYFTANAANIGYTWWSHDIGGHHFGKRDDELYLRWIQFGVFSPIMRLHSTSNEFMGKEPWKYRSSVGQLAVAAMRFRHRLIPYIYSANRLSNTEGRPLCEPMYYESPEDERAYEVPNEYYFGTELIACPITEPVNKNTNLAEVRVYLPEGRYTDIFTDRIYNGGRTLSLYRDEGSIPVLAKQGAIIPLDKNDRTNQCTPPENLELWIYRGNSSFTLYEDDGETQAFKDGAFAETVFEIEEKAKDILFTVNKPEGDLSVIPANRNLTLVFRDIIHAEEIEVCSNGKKRPVSYSEKSDSILIDINNFTSDEKITVTLKNVTARKNRDKKELLTELFSKLQGSNTVKQSLYADFVLKSKKTSLPDYLKGAVKEIESLFR